MSRPSKAVALIASTVAILAGAVFSSHRERQSSPIAAARIVELERDIRALQAMVARTTWEQQWQAARWIVERFEEAGLATTMDRYDHAGRSWPNVVARTGVAAGVTDVVVVAAHLDSIARDSDIAPGADDNATGVRR